MPEPELFGWYTPTLFARADVKDTKMNPNPTKAFGTISPKTFRPGPSPIVKVEDLNPKEITPAFISAMEGQWEARDTMDCEEADAVIGFLKVDERDPSGTKRHDGTKASLNIFAHGRYAHPLPQAHQELFNLMPQSRIKQTVVLNEKKNVAYLRWQREDTDGELQEIDWEQTCNGRFDHVDATLAIGGWKDEMKKIAKAQHEIVKRRKPILAFWGVDEASAEDELVLIEQTVNFLQHYKPKKLMISGKRAPKIAERAEKILSEALDQLSKDEKPTTFISGGADGVDSVFIRILGKF